MSRKKTHDHPTGAEFNHDGHVYALSVAWADGWVVTTHRDGVEVGRERFKVATSRAALLKAMMAYE